MSNRFQYQARPDEAWVQRKDQTGGQFVGIIKDGINIYTVQKQDNWVRVLPPTWANAKHFGYDVSVHYAVGPQKAVVLCLLKMLSKPCPVCEAYARAEAANRDDAKDYRVIKRVLVWVVDRKAEQKDPATCKPSAWPMPWTLDRDISKLCKDARSGDLYQIDHPDSGYDVTFDRDGEGMNVKYIGLQISRRPSAVDDRHLDYIVERALPSILIWRNYEEIVELMAGSQVESPTPQSPQQQQFAPPAPPTQEQPQYQPPPQQFNDQFAPRQQVVVPQEQVQPQQQYAPPPQQQQYVPPPNPSDQPIPSSLYCQNSITWQGQVIACNYAVSHQGPCDYSRAVGAAPIPQAPQQFAPQPVYAPPPQQQFAPQQQQAPMIAPRQVTNVQPQAPPPAPVQQQAAPGGSRAAALKERFGSR